MGPEVHMRRTYLWAREEGFSHADAECVARADVDFDSRYPARKSLGNLSRHFAPSAWLWSRRYFDRAVRGRDLAMLGYAIHCAQDAVAHGGLGQKHLQQRAGLGRDPDDWESASAGVRRRIEVVTRRLLLRFAGRGLSGVS